MTKDVNELFPCIDISGTPYEIGFATERITRSRFCTQSKPISKCLRITQD